MAITADIRTHAADFLAGSPAQISSAMTTAQPGDTVTMTNKFWQNADILFKGNGAATNPITLRAQTPGQVVLSGSSRLRIAGKFLVVDGLRFQFGFYTNSDVVQFRESSSSLATNCQLINCSIVNYSPPDLTVDNKWVSLYGLSNRVENCFFKGKTNAGATLVVWLVSGQTNFFNYHTVKRNYFGPRPDLGANGGETIRVGDSGTSFQNSRTLIEENLFQACNGEIEIISSKSCENVYRYNTFDGCQGTLTLRHGNRCTVQGNWFLGHGLPLTGGVRVIGEDHIVFNNYFDGLTGSSARSALTMMAGVVNSALNEYFQVKRATIAFNTFVGCSNNFLLGQQDGGGTLGPIDCTNANNIVRSSTGPLIKIVTAPTNFLWEGNLFSGAATGITNAGISTNNPLLILNSDGLWRPSTNSPAIDSSAGNYSFVTDDFDGQARISPADIGCDESAATSRTRRPLNPNEVGPLWMRNAGIIHTILQDSNGTTLGWSNAPGLSYQVQYATDFFNWHSAGPIVSNLSVSATWLDDGAYTGGAPSTTEQRYYRLALIP